MMNKTKAEIEQMASFICREKGQRNYYTEVNYVRII